MATCVACIKPMDADDRWRALRCEHHWMHHDCWMLRCARAGGKATCPGCTELADSIINTTSRQVVENPDAARLPERWTSFLAGLVAFSFVVGLVITLHHMWIGAVFYAVGPLPTSVVSYVASTIYHWCTAVGLAHGTEPSANFIWTIGVALPLSAAILHFAIFCVAGISVVMWLSRDHEPGKKKN